MLSYLDRKGRIPYGGAKRVAERLGVTEGHVSEVMHGRRRDRRVEKALAKLMRVSPVEAFGEPPLRSMRVRRQRVAA